jgi:hypothetical protein
MDVKSTTGVSVKAIRALSSLDDKRRGKTSIVTIASQISLLEIKLFLIGGSEL